MMYSFEKNVMLELTANSNFDQSDTKSDMSGSNMNIDMENSFLNSASLNSPSMVGPGSGEYESLSQRGGSQHG